MDSWQNCKNILVIRLDNMGDLLMSTPAIRALKETFKSKITVLTSSMAAGITPHIPEIDETITFDVPWVKTANASFSNVFLKMVDVLKEKQFDAAIIFTVFSQNPMPAVMLAYLADIPKRLAYCRENPYELLTNWVPDEEPYTLIKHQVKRDLDLVATVGTKTSNDLLSLKIPKAWNSAKEKLHKNSIDLQKPWIILHPGVSEIKRQYPTQNWIELGKRLIADFDCQVIITGSASEKKLTDEIQQGIGTNAFSVAGLLSLDEFICLIKEASLLIAVNTGPVHIAAATQTPVIVLYAQTNPQHTPWKTPNKVLFFEVPEALQSKNEVLKFVQKEAEKVPEIVAVEAILEAVATLSF
ncbi:glycosyltransferase family 9 protein [Mucilaginibacter arboris]|uniref:Glycosyltransferase family 9 protein n=1 Tax=Mucilaginibacter arboris TaxID=2682090 RepID=A0A7K1SSQ8_9SPHI|nr:glycosyltransferase family 9 protein [Mucilaginibacter arboris]MVN20335.1 glycosyltransferase family 9 protein [Mucilaginibacter arboris]